MILIVMMWSMIQDGLQDRSWVLKMHPKMAKMGFLRNS